MIFATVGTHQDGFARMLGALEQLGDGEELVVQHGNGAAPANATQADPFLPFGEMVQLFDRARVVVTHAGVGSILLATRAGHTPVVVPRLKRHGEHVDDHQVELARALEDDGHVLVCWEPEQLPALVAAVPPRRDRAHATERSLVHAIRELLVESGGEETDRGGTRPGPLSAAKARLRQGRVMRLMHDSFGAYFTVGVEFEPQPAGRHADPAALAGYYCDFSRKADPVELEPGSWLSEALRGAPWRSPMDVAQAALGFWERRMAGEDTDERFLALADWLVRYGTRRDFGLVWEHDYAVPKYGLLPGWVSGLTQGQVLSVLLRAHALSGEDRYRETARLGFGPFSADTAAGGVMTRLDGALVVEEYPTAAPTAVLNGWIFGMFGLHELSLVDDDPDVADTLARTRAGLLALLPRFDAGWWSRYSLGAPGRADLAKPFYQKLHVTLLDALHLIEPDPLLHATARRWERQITPVAMGRIAVDKVAFRVLRELPGRAG